MELYPAIDLRGGRCVRLRRGDFTAETVYDDDPVGVAREFAAAGARWLHVVDLDAARTGELTHESIIAAICSAVDSRVQVGGGIRDANTADALLAAGAARVVVGTAAVERPELITDLVSAHPGAVAVGLDARGRDVAVRGWQESGGGDLVELAARVSAQGAAAIVVTEISRDGTLAGPDLDQLGTVLAVTNVPVIASGGVASLDDLRTLAALEVEGRSPAGAIVGRAIYEGRVSVGEALATLGDGRYGRA